MSKIQEVAKKVLVEVVGESIPDDSPLMAPGVGTFKTIIDIIMSLLGAGGMCGTNPAAAKRRMIRQGPVERLSIWRTIKYHESNPAMWESLRAGIVKVGSSLEVDDYAGMIVEAKE